MDREILRILPHVEDAFGFGVPDGDAAQLNTVGQLYDYVLGHRYCEDQDQDPCLNSIAFFRIRRAMTSILRIPRDAVQESTTLSSVIPNHRRRTWRAIEKETGFRLPMLRRPHRIVMMATLAAIGLGVSVPLSFGLTPLHGATVVAIFTIAAFGYLFCRLTEPFAFLLPPGVDTVGELAKATLARNYQPILAESKESATDAEVWDEVRRIVAEQLGLSPGEITGEMELSKHLIAS
jgi:acyl carrier protein